MFTGIVTNIGRVRQLESRGDLHVVIATQYDVAAIDLGASIACAGCCLTVVDKGTTNDRWFAVTASAETLLRTTLGDWQIGDAVNLERPMRVGDELGGHIVTGHVDGIAEIVHLETEGESIRMRVEAPAPLLSFIAAKGSITLDGVSLTVNEVEGAQVGVNLIPHTLSVTTFGTKTPGAKVNLEVDLLARYVARMMQR